MTPRLVALALRAIAAGAPEPRHEPGGMGHMLPGDVEVGSLLYERVVVEGTVRLLPLLSHWSWLGWTLAEVKRRGFRLAIATGRDGGYSVSCGRAHPTEWVEWHPSREAALVAMLEATTPLHPASDRDSSPP